MIAFDAADEKSGVVTRLRFRVQHITGVQALPGDTEHCLILTDLRNWKVICHPNEAAKLIEAADRDLKRGWT